ncbi:penicillin-binding protein [Pyrinomonas methylaliphatogenes]|nr:penicillin-binding protein [Pyrinomonas methylaliphatogenes]
MFRGSAAHRTSEDSVVAGRRMRIVLGAFILWMGVIAGRLIYLQTSRHEELAARARAQQLVQIEIEPLRGTIIDRQGRELARSIETDSFFAVPEEIEDVQTVARRLAPLLGTEIGALASRLESARAEGRRFVWLARKLDAERAAAVRALALRGVYELKEPKRFYPNGALAAHVLGFVSLDEEGLAGVERFHNASLTGEEGRIWIERDAHRRSYESFEVAAREGNEIVLTLDQTIQHWAEQALQEAVERSQARAGTAIVLDPKTGEILALANAPTFDPNEARALPPDRLRNEALQNIYEPGSTFKIVSFAAALEEGLARPDERIDCQMGAIVVAGRTVHDHHPFGILTLTEALAKSSNVAAIKLGLRVGSARLYEYIRRFGFGAKTGVELPGETAGLLRPVERWQPSSIGSIAIGQEIGVTPLQVAAAFAAVANDGVRVAPHLVREVRSGDGAVVKRAQPEARRVISAETARTLRGMLEMVTLKGTARRAQLDGYTAAGKTGTAQKVDPRTHAYSKTKYVASFVGFAPASDPRVVIIVVIDEPRGAYHGGEVAAPVFREIAERVLPYLDVAPDVIGPNLADQMGARHSEARVPQVAIERRGEMVLAHAQGAGFTMPDLRGQSLRDAARLCAQLGLSLVADGEGRVIAQEPEAGAAVRAGDTVRVLFARSE